jgi:hypothetical protein
VAAAAEWVADRVAVGPAVADRAVAGRAVADPAALPKWAAAAADAAARTGKGVPTPWPLATAAAILD